MAQGSLSLGERYVLEAPIAEGGMTSLWRARDTVLARQVAVKILHPDLSNDEAFLTKFQREALAAARLAHPNILAIYDTGEEASGEGLRLYVVMEYCAKGSLKELLAGEGRLPPERVAELAGDICEGLGYAHNAGIIHRDLKPHNVLFNDHSIVKVGDFGIAEAAYEARDITTTRSLLGSVAYISPEQAEGGEPDARSDLYSLAAVLYECLVGRPPFEGASPIEIARAHADKPPLPLRSIKADIPRALDTAVMKALSKDPSSRYASAADMAEALAQSVGRRSSSFRSPARSVTATATRPSRKIFVLGLVGALLLTAGITLATRDGETPPGSTTGGGEQGGSADLQRVQPRAVSDLDPHAGDGENPQLTAFAADDDDGTAWYTSNYSANLSLIKPGVGLVFDLGEQATVAEIEVLFDEAGYVFELRASRSPVRSEEDARLVDSIEGSEERHRSSFDEPVEARFWVLWLREFPGARAGRGTVAEVRFFGD
jgi:hypothetical protein